MYGLLLDSIQKFLSECYGERYWDRIRRRANLKNQWFVTHEVYSDEVLPDLVKAAAAELGEDESSVMRMFGEYFAKNIGHYGYARLLRVLGRDLRDFLNGLDDLHEYLRFSYPKMSPPSFFCESETEEGIVLHYTSRRSGYLQYVIGQLTTVGRIYGKDLEIEVLSEEKTENAYRFVMKLKFDNTVHLRHRQPTPIESSFSIEAKMFFGVFPFCIMFDKDLVVLGEGARLQDVMSDLVGRSLTSNFIIRKPRLRDTPSWKLICLHANCVFELISVKSVMRPSRSVRRSSSPTPDGDYQSAPPTLRLKGQMMPFPDMGIIAFLCSPVMDSPEELYENGIYINDLAMHDFSRDIILAGSQKDPELNIALSQERIRSAQLEESNQQTDRLLFQMIPKPIADQLRNGEAPLNTCQEFSSVSILFSDIVSFTPMCTRLHPMEVVCVLNAMYVAFDRLCEVHNVYKVETIGDAYMVLCGAPVSTARHAEYATNFGLAIIDAITKINDPSTGHSLKIRVGIHSGNVVAGVVGSTILRYDVFGDTVNVAARMEATGEAMKVHISEATAELLDNTTFTLQARDPVNVRGKGQMKTFWVTGSSTAVEDKELFIDVLPSTPSPPTQRAQQISCLYGRPFSPNAAMPTTARERHASAPTKTSPSASPQARRHSLAISRTVTPKPNQWPMADRQLQRFSSSSAISESADLAPGQTAKVLERFKKQQTAPLILAQDDLSKRQLERRISTEQAEMFRKLSSSSSLKLALPHASREAPPLTPKFDLEMTPHEMLGEMELFAAQAEESARQSRQLADWAAGIVDHLRKEEGTSVDAPVTPPISFTTANGHLAEPDRHLTEQKESVGIDMNSAKCILM